MLIVTLSSIPPRFSRIKPCLQSLLAQTAPVDGIYLYIPKRYRRFPDWDGVLPEVPEGVEIRRCDEDFGPATKVLPAVRDMRGKDCRILFCDDDRLYPRDWAARFLDAARAHTDAAIASRGFQVWDMTGIPGPREVRPLAIRRWRSTDLRFQFAALWRRLRRGPNAPEPGRRVYRKSGYIDVFEGCSGVLIRPDMLSDTSFDIPAEAWSVDDIWLSGMLAANHVPIWLIANQLPLENTDAQSQAPLADAVIDGAGRDAANLTAIRHMQRTCGIWPEHG